MNNQRRAELIGRAQSEVWAIWQPWLDAYLFKTEITDEIQAAETAITIEVVSETPVMAMTRSGPKTGRVVKVPIQGAISKRASFWTSLFGGTTVEGLTKTLRELAADETVGTVLFDVHSPGGSSSGLVGLADEIRQLAESKHVVTLANDLMASAAYWIGSQADEIVATPDALVGSVGVYTVHDDWSGFNERIGIKPTYIYAGKYKVEGNPDGPLTDEARAHIQTLVDDTYRQFVGDVAKGRGISPADVRGNYGEGRVLTATEAKAAGMIDRIAGMDETIGRLTGRKTLTHNPSPKGEGGDGSNSQARIALMRRRLEIAQKQ